MKTKGFFSFCILAAALCTLLPVAGCSVFQFESQQTTGSEVFYEGRLNSRIERPIADVQGAAVAAYKAFGISVTRATSDRLSGVVLGELASGAGADTELSSISDGQTEVSIKVGGDGNRFISHRILEAIKGKLHMESD